MKHQPKGRNKINEWVLDDIPYFGNQNIGLN
jgi:hypothetical protein